jgi:hypothetical protein
MSQALRNVIPIMGLLQEMREQDFKVLCIEPYMYCTVFEDNSGALKLARLPKLCPRTEHINVCYHHFHEHVQKGLIKVFPVNTKDQIAYALTKPLAQNDCQRHCRFMLRQVTFKSNQSEGVLRTGYFGTYLRYLSKSIVISSISLSDQLHFIVTKYIVLSSAKRSFEVE